jgi:hypothetical protein
MSDNASANLVSEQIAPAERREHRRWPWWKIVLGYAVLFCVAVGSICTIDGHVLTATPRPSNHQANPSSAAPKIEWKSAQGQ